MYFVNKDKLTQKLAYLQALTVIIMRASTIIMHLTHCSNVDRIIGRYREYDYRCIYFKGSW